MQTEEREEREKGAKEEKERGAESGKDGKGFVATWSRKEIFGEFVFEFE